MAGLQRFIAYIYQYENDEKKEGAGFAKIELRGSICRMEVHLRTDSVRQPECTVYLFARNENLIQGIPVGNISAAKGTGDARYAFDTKALSNFGMDIEQMEGIFIPLEEGIFLASQWKEGRLAYGSFRVLGEEKQEEEPPSQSSGAKEEESPSPEDDGIREEQAQGGGQPIQATELPMEAFFEEAGWEGIFRKMRLKLEVFFPFEGREIECVRMQLRDLQEFPGSYWYFGKNSFLLHGFFNYRHLIFGEMTEDGKKNYILGVPGVFQNQERIMAAMFGFPEFCTAKAAEHKTGNFGYWYRII